MLSLNVSLEALERFKYDSGRCAFRCGLGAAPLRQAKSLRQLKTICRRKLHPIRVCHGGESCNSKRKPPGGSWVLRSSSSDIPPGTRSVAQPTKTQVAGTLTANWKRPKVVTGFLHLITPPPPAACQRPIPPFAAGSHRPPRPRPWRTSPLRRRPTPSPWACRPCSGTPRSGLAGGTAGGVPPFGRWGFGSAG